MSMTLDEFTPRDAGEQDLHNVLASCTFDGADAHSAAANCGSTCMSGPMTIVCEGVTF
ncbi:hypothetical protein [Streptomyces sp. SudanB182_2057]|uniref:hypothetical protein n=1 Tax=Streptomyces sp. SudanB182_2057 TaxID=3035281 RepID=UPI003F55DD4C